MAHDSAKEEIKRRVDLVAYIQRFVPLQKSGRRHRGRCPFHQERNPSFYVDGGAGLFKCFGCGAAGDVFAFAQRIHNLTFPEAAEQLAAEVGVEWRPVQAADRGRQSLRQAIFRANDLALRFFVEALKGPEGAAARDYLASRGLAEDTVGRFELGYAPPDEQALQRFLTARGLARDLCVQAGLIHGSGRDVFIQRVIFPVRDVTGRVIAFGGRTLIDDPAKYINSPDTPVFKKGETLYGLTFARNAAAGARRIVIVEGYTDVIALNQAGIENVVACLGTALTPAHLLLASRYADEIVLAYDADAAGLKAALRDISMFEQCPAEVKIALLSEGHDPDTLVRTEGPEAFQAIIARAAPASEFKLQMALASFKTSDRLPDEALETAAAILCEVPSPSRRVEFLDHVADWWGGGDAQRTSMMRRALWLEIGRKLRDRPQGQKPSGPQEPDDREIIIRTVAAASDADSGGRLLNERTVLKWAVNDPEAAAEIFSVVEPDAFCCRGHRPIAEALASQVEAEEFRPDDLPALAGEDAEVRDVVATILLQDVFEAEREEFASSLQKILLLARCGIGDLRWEPSTRDVDDIRVPEAGVDLEALRREIIARLDRGEISADDPLYQEYRRVSELLHGRHGTEYYRERRVSSAGSLDKLLEQERRRRRGSGGQR
jgi:DNA primase